jgi:hypothetical protein
VCREANLFAEKEKMRYQLSGEIDGVDLDIIRLEEDLKRIDSELPNLKERRSKMTKFSFSDAPRLQLLSRDEVEAIHLASLKLLEETGLKIYNDRR